jgi:hypothetical protein
MAAPSPRHHYDEALLTFVQDVAEPCVLSLVCRCDRGIQDVGEGMPQRPELCEPRSGSCTAARASLAAWAARVRRASETSALTASPR